MKDSIGLSDQLIEVCFASDANRARNGPSRHATTCRLRVELLRTQVNLCISFSLLSLYSTSNYSKSFIYRRYIDNALPSAETTVSFRDSARLCPAYWSRAVAREGVQICAAVYTIPSRSTSYASPTCAPSPNLFMSVATPP